MGTIQNRKKMVTFRLTGEEYSEVQNTVKEKGFDSVSDYVRERVLSDLEAGKKKKERVQNYRDLFGLLYSLYGTEENANRIFRRFEDSLTQDGLYIKANQA